MVLTHGKESPRYIFFWGTPIPKRTLHKYLPQGKGKGGKQFEEKDEERENQQGEEKGNQNNKRGKKGKMKKMKEKYKDQVRHKFCIIFDAAL